MTDTEVRFRADEISRRMQEACVTHKVQMRKLEQEIRQVQAACRHPGEWWDRCPSCGKPKEVAS